MLIPYFTHKRTCWDKQNERASRILEAGSPAITAEDTRILNKTISEIAAEVQSRKLDPNAVLSAFTRKALQAHEATNCLTEVMVSSAREFAQKCNRDGPLAGVPVSLKDSIAVKGWDGCIGYSAKVGQPAQKDAAIIRILRDAGAVPFVKTNVPITLLSFESTNDVFGRTTNPHNKDYSPGGSTGGEAALLAFGGSRIGIGTDVAGSVRVPSHYSGVYAVKASFGRFPRTGGASSIPGQEGVSPVVSPMARTLDDLEYFWRVVIGMEPWKYDHSVVPLPWRPFQVPKARKLRWGVMRSDGIVSISPACTRALNIVVDVLKRNGHEVFDISPPNPYDGIRIGSQLIYADGGQICSDPIRRGETIDPGVIEALGMFRISTILRKLYTLYIRYIKGDEIYAGLLDGWYAKSAKETWGLIAKKEMYKADWFEFWEEEKLDFVLTAPNALPSVPHGGMKKGWRNCGYSFLFNILDYSAGVLPITKVDKTLDLLPNVFKAKNRIEKGTYEVYNAEKMHGLPVGVQIVGKRLEEEKVLEGMKIVERLLKEEGQGYEILSEGPTGIYA